MALDEMHIGRLMTAVSLLQSKEILSVEQADAAVAKIRELSDTLARKVEKTLTSKPRRTRSAFFKDLPADAEIRKFLPEDKLLRMSSKHAKLLIFLFENRDRICTQQELLQIGWSDEQTSPTLLGPRLQELRDRIEPHMVITTYDKQGYQLSVKQV